MNDLTTYGVFSVLVIGIGHIFMAVITSRNIKEMFTTKQEYDRIKKKEQELNNSQIFLNAERDRLLAQADELQAIDEQLGNQIQALSLQKLEMDLSNFSTLDNISQGVFYDKENDTLVLFENLERIGEK